MCAQYAPAIAALQTQVQQQERELRETKRLINKLSKLEGVEPPFPAAEDESSESVSIGTMRRDLFYGVALATAIRKYLEMRRAAGHGPATVNDIYGALVSGGYKFETANERNAKRGLYISLAKNSVTFHKLPSPSGNEEASVFGLLEWYPNAKATEAPKKPKKLKRPKKLPKVSPPTSPASTDAEEAENDTKPRALPPGKLVAKGGKSNAKES
jgi:hypothetical protein